MHYGNQRGPRNLAALFFVALFVCLSTMTTIAAEKAAGPKSGEPAAGQASSSENQKPTDGQLDVNRAELEEMAKGRRVHDRSAFGLVARGAAAPANPMFAEIDELMHTSREQLTELQHSFDAAPSAEAALKIQRQIDTLKQETEIGILQIQARFAREAGRTELAQQIEADVEKLRSPVVRKAPMPRAQLEAQR